MITSIPSIPAGSAGTILGSLPATAGIAFQNGTPDTVTNSADLTWVPGSGGLLVGDGATFEGTVNVQRQSADNLGESVNLVKYGSAGTGATGAIASGANIGQQQWVGYDGTGLVAGALINAVAAETWTSTAHGTTLTFWTRTGNGALTERITILGNGDVGIGTTAPAVKLHIETATGPTIRASRSSNTANGSVPSAWETRAPNASGAARLWSSVTTTVVDATSTTEASSVAVGVQQAGVFVTGLTVSGTQIAGPGSVKSGVFTVATLPVSPGEGARAAVNDALTPVALDVVVGGGAEHVPVFFNGTNWIVG